MQIVIDHLDYGDVLVSNVVTDASVCNATVIFRVAAYWIYEAWGLGHWPFWTSSCVTQALVPTVGTVWCELTV
jgi:hypothetical protein